MHHDLDLSNQYEETKETLETADKIFKIKLYLYETLNILEFFYV